MSKYTLRRRQRGQTLIIVAGAIIALIALVALAVDGGNAYAQRRIAQNAVDGGATAGTVKMETFFLANRNGATVYPMTTAQDHQVLQAIKDALQATSPNVDLRSVHDTANPGTMEALYIDNNGAVYGSPVGFNTSVPFADGNSAGSPGAAGVLVSTTSSSDTYFARLVGVNKVSADARGSAQLGHPGDVTDAAIWPIAMWKDYVAATISGSAQMYEFKPSGSSTFGPGNFGDVQWSNSNGNSHNCVNNPDSFDCMMLNGYNPGNAATPLVAFQELPNGNPSSQRLTPTNRIPLGWDGTHTNSTGFWVGTQTGNRLSSYNNSDIQNDVASHRKVFIPVIDRAQGNGNNTQFHVITLAAYEITAADCCGNANSITGKFIGYGWGAGQADWQQGLAKSVIDGQVIIRLGR